MKIYHFADNAPLTLVVMDDGGAKDGTHAVLFARAGLAAGSLSKIRHEFDAAGMFVAGDVENGQQVLRVYDIGSEEHVLNILRKSGVPPISSVDHDATHHTRTLAKNLQDISVKGAGIGFTVADLALVGSGYMSGRYKECITGSIFSVGSMLLAKYGNKSSELHLNDLSCKLGNYLKESGYDLSTEGPVSLERLKRCEGFTKQLETFMYAHPTQVFNSFVAVAGVPLMMSGMQHRKPFDTLAGALVTGGALCGLLIPEKKPDTSVPQEQKSTWQKAKEWVQERPLRIPSIMWAANNFSMFVSAMKERAVTPAQKSYRFKFAGVAANLTANAFTFISSKDEATGFATEPENVSALEAVAVQMIMAQPKAKQHEVIDQIAGFLSAQPEVKIPASTLAKEMRNKIAQLEQSPWYTPTTPAVIPEKRASEPAASNWVERVHPPELHQEYAR